MSCVLSSFECILPLMDEEFEDDPYAFASKRVLYAILERAILDTLMSDSWVKRDSIGWIRKPINIYTHKAWQFSWVAMQLDLDPYVLQRIIINDLPKLDICTKNRSSGVRAAIERIYNHSEDL